MFQRVKVKKSCRLTSSPCDRCRACSSPNITIEIILLFYPPWDALLMRARGWREGQIGGGRLESWWKGKIKSWSLAIGFNPCDYWNNLKKKKHLLKCGYTWLLVRQGSEKKGSSQTWQIRLIVWHFFPHLWGADLRSSEFQIRPSWLKKKPKKKRYLMRCRATPALHISAATLLANLRWWATVSVQSMDRWWDKRDAEREKKDEPI